MNKCIIFNDIRGSRLITVTTTAFVAAAAMLVALAAVLVVNLAGSIDNLMERGQMSHFMQRHAGEYDAVKLEEFMRRNQDIDDHQALEFLNVDGTLIVIGGSTLAHSVQDNSFSVQSDRFEFLLDMDNQVIEPIPGQVYLPLSYMKDGTANPGDELTVGDVSLTVAGFLRESQMNSTLSSSKRFLVHKKDYAALLSGGSMEYLIEFRLHDLSRLGAFEPAYMNAGVGTNGLAVTYPQFRMINALTEGLMIAVIPLISALVIAIALLCIRFTLPAVSWDLPRPLPCGGCLWKTSGYIWVRAAAAHWLWYSASPGCFW